MPESMPKTIARHMKQNSRGNNATPSVICHHFVSCVHKLGLLGVGRRREFMPPSPRDERINYVLLSLPAGLAQNRLGILATDDDMLVTGFTEPLLSVAVAGF